MSEGTEQIARGIAARGRDQLIERLRAAFAEAAAAHAETVTLEQHELERMVEHAAERADGLQWHRALAAVASEQLGISLGEALNHPAVVRAHAMLGAPSYEEGLARLGPLPATTPPEAEAPADAEAVTDDGEDEPTEPPADDESLEPASSIHVTGTHLGGIAALGSPEPGVELWFSEEGLDIVRQSKEPLGRLGWGELRALEFPTGRGWLGRRRRPVAYLVVRGEDGDASFEIPGMTPDELRDQLSPVLNRA